MPSRPRRCPRRSTWRGSCSGRCATRSWTAQLPAGGQSLVTLRELAPGPEVLAHPLGTLQVRQRVAPLERTIDRFGADVPSGVRLFRIAGVTLGSDPAETETLQDLFAPAQFRALTDDQKLSQPSFESMPSGVRIGEVDVDHGTPVEVQVIFEQRVIGASGETVEPDAPVPLPGDVL